MSMQRETREFVASVFQGAKADGKLETLLTSTVVVRRRERWPRSTASPT